MDESFDPYTEWLRIPRQRRPPSRYDLLGLKPFEEDAERIQAAFQERYEKVRVYQAGARGDVALRVLDELSQAYHVLSDPAKKQFYDRELSALSDRLVYASPADSTDPWSSVDQLLRRFDRQTSHADLEKGEALARRLDPIHGVVRFSQGALRAGVISKTLRQRLLEFAGHNGLAVCGQCFEFIKRPLAEPYIPAKLAPNGTIVFSNATIRLVRGSIRHRIRIESKESPWKDIDGTTVWTTRGRAVLLSTIIVGAALLLAAVGVPFPIVAVAIVSTSLAAGVWMVKFAKPTPISAIDAVWKLVVPTMMEPRIASPSGFSPVEAAWLAGLALVSVGQDGGCSRRARVETITSQLRAQALGGTLPFEQFARVAQLVLSDGWQFIPKRLETVRFAGDLFFDCLSGSLPFKTWELAFRNGSLVKEMPLTCLIAVRLQILWRCFSANRTVMDVLTMIEHLPTLRRMFCDDIARDKALVSKHFAVWRHVNTWQAAGICSAFQFAASGDWSALDKHPEAFLASADQSIVADPRGLKFHGVPLTEGLQPIIRRLTTGFELELAGKIVERRDDPAETVDTIQRLSKWYFQQFSRHTANEVARTNNEPLPASLYGDLVTCRDCQATYPFLAGEILVANSRDHK